jgi:ribosome-binding factor A
MVSHNYRRADRVADLLKEEISQMLLKEVKDPRIGFVTITGVEVSKDLQVAKVFYTVLGDTAQVKESDEALSRVSHYIKRQLGKRLRMRYIPDVIFKYDHSLEYGAKIDSILEHIRSAEELDTES